MIILEKGKLDLNDSDLKVGKTFTIENRVYEITDILRVGNYVNIRVKMTLDPFGFSYETTIIIKA